jgi:DNA-binding NarL/FixJ family response regulator
MRGWLGAPPSGQELAVLQLVAQGLSNKLIAHHLGVTEKTVKAHVTHLLEKAGAQNRVELVRCALKARLVPADEDTAR